MKKNIAVLVLMLIMSAAGISAATAGFPRHGFPPSPPVEIFVQNDQGYTLPMYRTNSGREWNAHRYYLEAAYGDRYSILVRNNTHRRIGVVIAVDGRNIISGKESNVQPEEKMYIIGGRQVNKFEGWRSTKDAVNRFYFTDPGDSYAGKFGDYSAMGVIAVAVFEEYPPPRPIRPYGEGGMAPPGHQKPSAGTEAPSGAAEGKSFDTSLKSSREQMGTGYGEEKFSPSAKTEFRANPYPMARYFMKYETRTTLIKLGVIDQHYLPKNRFWDNDREGYASPPPTGSQPCPYANKPPHPEN